MSNIILFEWTIRIASIGVLLCSLEMLVKRSVLGRSGLLSPEVAITRSPVLMTGGVRPALDFLFQPRIAIALLTLRVLLSIAVWLGEPSAIEVGFLALSGVYLSLRSPYGLDGSDQMTNIVFFSCSLGLIVGTPVAKQIVLIFLAAMVCQAYFVSGLEKLKSGIWRSGKAISSVALTKLYGVRSIGDRLTQMPSMCLAMAWFVILFEFLFPFGLLAPHPGWWIALISAGLFHLFAAAFMGLNTFFWAFLSTYPAVIFCRSSFGW